jgi:hypothetical protein
MHYNTRSSLHNITQHHAALRSTTQHHAALRSTTQHYTTPQIITLPTIKIYPQDMIISHVIDDYLFRTLCDKAVSDERDRESHGSARNLMAGGGGGGGGGGVAGSSGDAATEGTFRLPLEGNLYPPYPHSNKHIIK